MAKKKSTATTVAETNKQKRETTPSFTFTWDTSKITLKSPFVKKRKNAKQNETVIPVNKLARKQVDKTKSKEAVNNKKTPVSANEYNKLSNLSNSSVVLSSDSDSELEIKEYQKKSVNKSENICTTSNSSVSENVFAKTGDTFRNLPIHQHLVSNLEKNGFVKLTVVQEKALPVVSLGKNVLIRSQTGSGKTLAYAIPIIDTLRAITPKLSRKDGVQTLIVVPTRELALQTFELFLKINTFQWVVTGMLCGGEKRKTEKDKLRKGVNILIGTPGRLLDHIVHTTALKVDKVRCLVIDEADRLMEMGFRKDVVKLVEELDRAKINSQYNPLALLRNQQNQATDKSESEDAVEENEMPLKNIQSVKRQTILLSATLTKAVTELAEFAMKDHVFVDALDENVKTTLNSHIFIIPNTVKQEYVIIEVKQKLTTLAAFVLTKCKQGNSKIFIFMASSQMVNFHYNLFSKYFLYLPKIRGSKSEKIVICEDESENDSSDGEEEIVLDTEFFKLHGSMDQKIRKEVFIAFRKAKKGVLFCTDVAARGLDVPTADYIVQYNGPQSDDDYVHRVGRTGRAGKSGGAIIFLTPEEQEYVKRLESHKVFLKKVSPEVFTSNLCDLMEESNREQASIALQRRFETAINKDRELFKEACFAYSSWSRFYNSYSASMRAVFNFKNVNLGHYASSFAIREPPSYISKVVRGQVSHLESPKLNPKLNIHEEQSEGDDLSIKKKNQKPKKKRSVNLITSEFESGFVPSKKKKKVHDS